MTPSEPTASPCTLYRAYPWLLALSTAIAGLFCLMYLTKPVILTPITLTPPRLAPPPAKPVPAKPGPAKAASQTRLLPSGDRLPGDAATAPAASAPRPGSPAPSAGSAFEETNLRIQHILTAEAPGGYQARLDLDVPVLYQSRNLRWTPAELADARKLLVRLMDYQEKSQRLRVEGSELLEDWNRLIDRSLPAAQLRADSPSLPANQEDAAGASRPGGLSTPESIQIQPAGQ